MEQLRLEFGGGHYDGQGVLFNGFSGNGLFYWNIAENQTYFLGDFHKDPVWCKWMFYMAVKRKNIFFFLPFMAHGIPYYDAAAGKIRYCGLPSSLENKLLNYYGYVEEDNLMYMFPVDPFEDVLILDMEHRHVSGILTGWNKNLIRKLSRNQKPLINGFSYRDGKAWISGVLAGEILELQFHSWEVRSHAWKEIGNPIILSTNDDGFWIEDQGNASVYHIDTSGQILERYEGVITDRQGLRLFSRVIRLNQGIRLVLPQYADQLLMIGLDQCVHCRLLDEEKHGSDGKYLCYHYLEFEGEVWLFPHSQNDIIIINLRNYKIKYKRLPVPAEWMRISPFISKMQSCESRFVVEQGMNGVMLQDLCDYLKSKREYIEEKDESKSYGVKIWGQISKR